MIVLVDCNNFYVSCEQIFNPKIRKKPAVVLSNNDGCIIARSKEAKELKILMGEPIFKYQHLVEAKKLIVLSANFTLYADISQRVMQIIKTFNLRAEIYSIDEAFLFVENDIDHYQLAKDIKQRIKQWLGIDVSVSIAPTKTLAKIANETAKKSGICILKDLKEIDLILSKTLVEEIWGIGDENAPKLKALGIITAKELKDYDSSLIKKKLSVNLQRSLLELNGIEAFSLEEFPKAKKSIVCSRSFSKEVADYNELSEVISSFTAMAANKLRNQKSNCSLISVFLMTNPFGKKPFHADSFAISFLATSYTPQLIKKAKEALSFVFNKELSYKKAGVMLSDITSEEALQLELFESEISPKKNELMNIVDKMNKKFNANKIYFAAEGIEKKWKGRSDKKSAKFTTSWNELIKVK